MLDLDGMSYQELRRRPTAGIELIDLVSSAEFYVDRLSRSPIAHVIT
jgi:hypothetical protein